MKKNIIKYILLIFILFMIQIIYNLMKTNMMLSNDLSKTKKTLLTVSDENKNLNTQIEILNGQLLKQDKQIETMSKELSILKANPFVYYSPNNLLIKSNVTVNQLKRVFKDTNMEGLEPFIVNAEKTYGVNAFFVSGLIATECNWGGSDRAIKQNNLTGHGVYVASSRGSTFNSKESNIMETTRMLKHNYLTKNGEFYNGTSIWAVNMRYSLHPDKTINTQWAITINSIAMGFKDKINNGGNINGK